MDMQLGKLLRRKVAILGPKILETGSLITVTLVGVESTGVWVESAEAAARIAEQYRLKPAGLPAFFIPFGQITTIIASQEMEEPAETV